MATPRLLKRPHHTRIPVRWTHIEFLLNSRLGGMGVSVAYMVWRSGWDADHILNGGLFMAAIPFVMLHTRAGRSLLLLGWYAAVGIFVLNLVFLEFEWEIVEGLAILAVVGALWFVNWEPIIRKLEGRE